MGTDNLDEHEPRKENGDIVPDFGEEPLTDPDVRISNWDRVFRMLRKITDKVNHMDQRLARIEANQKKEGAT